jgi:hypothetical protein
VKNHPINPKRQQRVPASQIESAENRREAARGINSIDWAQARAEANELVERFYGKPAAKPAAKETEE